MKSLYEIKNKHGKTICFQVANSPSDALTFARMYGHKGVKTAVFIRED